MKQKWEWIRKHGEGGDIKAGMCETEFKGRGSWHTLLFFVSLFTLMGFIDALNSKFLACWVFFPSATQCWGKKNWQLLPDMLLDTKTESFSHTVQSGGAVLLQLSFILF